MIYKLIKKHKWLIPVAIVAEIATYALIGDYILCDWINFICFFEGLIK